MITSSSTYRLGSALAAACVVACALTGAARAADTSVSPPRVDPRMSTMVQASDVDLSTRAGARKMLARIRQASQRVCLADEGGYIFLGQGIARCEEETTAEAIARLNDPVVTALYQGHAVTALARR